MTTPPDNFELRPVPREEFSERFARLLARLGHRTAAWIVREQALPLFAMRLPDGTPFTTRTAAATVIVEDLVARAESCEASAVFGHPNDAHLYRGAAAVAAAWEMLTRESDDAAWERACFALAELDAPPAHRCGDCAEAIAARGRDATCEDHPKAEPEEACHA